MRPTHHRPALLLAAVSLLVPVGGQAATFEVTSTADAGTGSLRAAIAAANATASPPHTIVFGAGFPLRGTIVLQSNLPQLVNGRLTIDGNGREPTVSGGDVRPILLVNTGLTVLELRGLHLTAGRNSAGGCVFQDAFNSSQGLRVVDSTFSGCTAIGGSDFPRGGAIHWVASGGLVDISGSAFIGNTAGTPGDIAQSAGGAINATGSLRVVGSRFIGNAVRRAVSQPGGIGGAIRADPRDGIAILEGNRFEDNTAREATAAGGDAGAVYVGCNLDCVASISGNYFVGNVARSAAALFTGGTSAGATVTAQIENNTFFNNEALLSGAGLFVSTANLNLEHNTFLGNRAPSGAHLRLLGGINLGRLVHNAFAATATGTACELQSNTPATTGLTNLFADGSCSGLGASGAVAVADFRVAGVDGLPLIGVVRFAADSPVIDGATNTAECLAFDARGTARPLDGDGDGQARCDIGAFEHAGEVVFRNGFEAPN